MVVYFEGQIHRIPVKQGPDGLKEFQKQIRDLFRWDGEGACSSRRPLWARAPSPAPGARRGGVVRLA
jgi:uncharacterized protein involved in type VI secretion and phage assembly